MIPEKDELEVNPLAVNTEEPFGQTAVGFAEAVPALTVEQGGNGEPFKASAPISTGVSVERVSPSKSSVIVDINAPVPSIGVGLIKLICKSGVAPVGSIN